MCVCRVGCVWDLVFLSERLMDVFEHPVDVFGGLVCLHKRLLDVFEHLVGVFWGCCECI